MLFHLFSKSRAQQGIGWRMLYIAVCVPSVDDGIRAIHVYTDLVTTRVGRGRRGISDKIVWAQQSRQSYLLATVDQTIFLRPGRNSL